MAGNVHEHQRQRQRSVNTLALSATVHCLSGCAIGEVLGMVPSTWWGWAHCSGGAWPSAC
jgi:hypothetical protein